MEKNTPNKIRTFFDSPLSYTFIALGIFFIPFNSYDGIPFLGEFSRESCFLFFSFAFFIEALRFVYTHKIKIPLKNPIFIILILTLVWFLLSYFLNYFDISGYYIKKTSGNERFLRQYGALIISSVFLLLTYYNIFRRFSIKWLFTSIRKIFFYSFLVVTVYTLIEACIIYLNMRFLDPLLRIFDYFPFQETWVDYKSGRLSSVSYAPPVFGMYLMTIAGWMFSYMITHKSILYTIPTFLILVFTFLSGSRSALAVIFFQLIVFLLYLIKHRNYHKRLIKIGLVVFILSTPFLILKGKIFGEYIVDKITSFNLDDSTHAISNKSRLGIIYTSGLVFLENPIKGVGFGQQAYAARPLYPKWATKNNWEFEQKYLNDDIKVFPPSYNVYTRLLAETGIIGFSLFTLLIITIIYTSYMKTIKKNQYAVYYLVLLTSFSGYAVNWLQVDTFRIFGFWICLALLLILTNNNVKLKINRNIDG